MKYVLLMCCILGAIFPAFGDIQFKLGSVERVSKLFSYPSNCHVICFHDQTLEETVDVYLTSSVKRDGYAQSEVIVNVDNDKVLVTITGEIPATYQTIIEQFLQAGDLALAGAKKLHADEQWRANWRFYLPLGLAMQHHKSLQILHFPPDYVLNDVQDYLDTNTTKRWGALLTINGVPQAETDRFQTIIDIAPIAAPSLAGKTLKNTYNYFSAFTTSLIEHWTTPKSETSATIPVVVFGWPARNWFAKQYNIALDVLSTGIIELENGRKVAVIGANHPSYIWYAGNVRDNPQGKPETENDAYQRALKVMTEDLTVACWQSKMAGASLAHSEVSLANVENTLASCQSKWAAQPKQVCELYHQQAKRMSEAEAKLQCEKTSES